MYHKAFTLILAMGCAVAATAMNPKADPASVVTSGNARFSVLTPELIRIEYSDKGVFEDNPTFTFVNREMPVPAFSVSDNGSTLSITTDRLSLNYIKGTDPRKQPEGLTIELTVDGRYELWNPSKEDSGNLGGTMRTLDRYNGRDGKPAIDKGILSRNGWTVVDDSPSAVRSDGSRSLAFGEEVNGIPWVQERADKDAMDIYFFGYGHDYKKALGDYALVAGRTPLPPIYVFGYWYSRYQAYTADEFREIARELAANDINTDVMILDMDWHWNGNEAVSGGRGGWTGWTWNTRLIPDPEGLLSDLHKSDLKTALNLHPADGVAADEDFYAEMCSDLGRDAASGNTIPWALEDSTFYKSFTNNILRAREAQGIDFWWIDWQQNLTNKRMPALGETFWCNHVFFNDIAKNRPGLRPVIFHRWGGLGSHRYQIGFSGDTFINFPTLAALPYFTSTASNVGYGYWGHDLGGHMRDDSDVDPNDPELLVRWVQFGVFTPIFRTHATSDPSVERRIWTYDEFPLLNAAVKLRYRLMPYLYTMARKSYDTGIGICRPMYYEYPSSDIAYTADDQYFFGDDILVAPVVEAGKDGIAERNLWLPEGRWWSPDKAMFYDGGKTINENYALDEIPYFLRQGAVIPANTSEVKRANSFASHNILDVVVGDEGEGTLYEDAGNDKGYDKAYSTIRFSQKPTSDGLRLTIHPRQGSFDGMPSEKAYTVRFYGAQDGSRVMINGKKATSSYNSADKCIEVEVSARPCNRETTIDILN